MQSQRLRPLFIAVAAVVLIWLVAIAGYTISRSTKMTPEKIRQYMHSIDFAKLSPEERARVLKRLADMLNAVPREDRHRGDDQDWKNWFTLMTEQEKEQFIEATLPTDIKQMLDAFEKMPAEKRKKVVDNAIRNMRNDQNQSSGGNGNGGTNTMAQLSPESQQRLQTLGLRTFYSESSAETKAELAPLLEELQHQMENGRMIR